MIKLKQTGNKKDGLVGFNLKENQLEYLAQKMGEYGLTVSDAVNIFLNQLVKEKSFVRAAYYKNIFKDEKKTLDKIETIRKNNFTGDTSFSVRVNEATKIKAFEILEKEFFGFPLNYAFYVGSQESVSSYIKLNLK